MRNRDPWLRGMGAALVAALIGVGPPARAEDDACREWRGEHAHWRAEAVSRYLRGAPQSALDAAVFELLQREAWLTSCKVPVHTARDAHVGWRLVDRDADEYGAAVVESLLAQAGFDLALGALRTDPAPLPAVASPPRFRPRWSRAR